MILALTLLLTLIFATESENLDILDPWGGQSVTTSDNLDASNFNPAGYAVDNGTISGWYLEPDSNGKLLTENSIFHYGFRSNGFGLSLKYKNGDRLLNATDFNISFAGAFHKSLLFGANWSKLDEELSIGLLYRPANFISLGGTLNVDDDSNKPNGSRLGLALRPTSKETLTFGMDMILNPDFTFASFSPFINLTLCGGLTLKSQFYTDSFNDNFDMSNISFLSTINFNLGKKSIYFTNPEPWVYGFGYNNSNYKKETLFNKPKKDVLKYIRFSLAGLFIEENTEKVPFTFGASSLFSNPQKGQHLKSWLDEINKFAEDETVAGLIIDLGYVNAGFSKKEEMHDALLSFKNTGKKIIVYAEYGISNTDYFLISMADEIYINDMTGVNLKGLSMEVTFYREMLDSLNIVPEVFRVNIDGESYKTAGDSFLERTASPQMKENYGELLTDLYSIFVEKISIAKGWNEEQTLNVINNGPYGISSELIKSGLITNTMYPDQFDDYVNDLTSSNETDSDNDESSKDKNSYEVVKWYEIDRSTMHVSDWKSKEKDKIALIYAVGGIVSGESNTTPSGSSTMGDKTIREAIKSARENKDIKAIVLRIDSGGGSALASDQMWREILLTTENEDSTKNKPFIASMSSVSASGGYYIACQADKIIASNSTITGSIGVIGLSLNLSKFFKQYGINTEIVSKMGEHADFSTGSRLRSEYETKKIEEGIEDIYQIFKNKVIKGRDELNDTENLDEIAMGRIWTGGKGQNHKLVDEIGGINDAIILAAKEAGIEDINNIAVVEYPRRDLAYEIKMEIDQAKSLLVQEIISKDLYDYYVKSKVIYDISKNGDIMMIPHSIVIK